MECPHCHNRLILQPRAFNSAQYDNKPSLAVTKCCSLPVTVRAKVSFVLEKYEGDLHVDDWGESF